MQALACVLGRFLALAALAANMLDLLACYRRDAHQQTCSLIHKCTAIRQTRQIIGQRAMLQGLLALDAAGDVLDLRNDVDRTAVGAAPPRDIELALDGSSGRAWCRERVCQAGESMGTDDTLNNKPTITVYIE